MPEFEPATKKPALPPASRISIRQFRLRSEPLMRGFERRGLLPCDRALYRRLHLLERPHFDLAHALAGDAELRGEVFQRHRLVRQAPGLEDPAFARVEHADRAI